MARRLAVRGLVWKLNSEKGCNSPKTRAVEETEEAVLVDPVAGHRHLGHQVLEVTAGVVGEEAGVSCIVLLG